MPRAHNAMSAMSEVPGGVRLSIDETRGDKEEQHGHAMQQPNANLHPSR